MKLYTTCSSCDNEISFNSWIETKVDYKRFKGHSIELTCKNCNKTKNYEVELIYAKESKIAKMIALIIFLFGTPIYFIYIYKYLNVNGKMVFGLLVPLVIPSIIYEIIIKSDRQRVKNFNNS